MTTINNVPRTHHNLRQIFDLITEMKELCWKNLRKSSIGTGDN